MSKSHPHLNTNPEVVPGQAHFSGTGPPGRACRQCAHWAHEPGDYDSKGYIKPVRCRQFTALTNQLGAKVPAETPACRHYAPTDLAPAPFTQPNQLKRGIQTWK
jgi:hypothetical protein